MKTDFDPIVAEALERIAPPVEIDPEAVLRAARAQAQAERRESRRLPRAAIVAFAVAVLAGGTAYAATRLDLVPWLNTKSPSNVRFSVDVKKVFHGPAPQSVSCPHATSTGEFTCRVSNAAPTRFELTPLHWYLLSERIEPQPTITRAFILRRVATAERNGTIPRLLAHRIRVDAGKVGGDFFAKLNVLLSVRGLGTSPVTVEELGHRPLVLVPPKNAVVIVVCTSRAAGALRCRDLAAAQGVPIGAPVYTLQAAPDWIPVKRAPRIEVPAPAGLFRRVFGRPLTARERRLLFALFLTSVRSGHSEVHASPPVRVSPRKPR